MQLNFITYHLAEVSVEKKSYCARWGKLYSVLQINDHYFVFKKYDGLGCRWFEGVGYVNVEGPKYSKYTDLLARDDGIPVAKEDVFTHYSLLIAVDIVGHEIVTGNTRQSVLNKLKRKLIFKYGHVKSYAEFNALVE